MKLIEKKILPKYFNEIIQGNKTFELRKDEENYQVGDILILKEWENDLYTSREIKSEITYVLRNVPEYGLQDGYCIISFNVLSARI